MVHHRSLAAAGVLLLAALAAPPAPAQERPCTYHAGPHGGLMTAEAGYDFEVVLESGGIYVFAYDQDQMMDVQAARGVVQFLQSGGQFASQVQLAYRPWRGGGGMLAATIPLAGVFAGDFTARFILSGIGDERITFDVPAEETESIHRTCPSCGAEWLSVDDCTCPECGAEPRR